MLLVSVQTNHEINTGSADPPRTTSHFLLFSAASVTSESRNQHWCIVGKPSGVCSEQVLFEAHDSWDADDGSDLCWEFYESHGHVSLLPARISAHAKGRSGPALCYFYLSCTSSACCPTPVTLPELASLVVPSLLPADQQCPTVHHPRVLTVVSWPLAK